MRNRECIHNNLRIPDTKDLSMFRSCRWRKSRDGNRGKNSCTYPTETRQSIFVGKVGRCRLRLFFHRGNGKYRQLPQAPVQCLPIALELWIVFGALC